MSSLEELKSLSGKTLQEIREESDGSLPGLQGPPGPPGPPGTPGTPGSGSSDNPRIEVPGAVVFQTLDALLQVTAVTPVGTMAYIIVEQSLLVRVNLGWQYIALSNLILEPTEPPSPSPTSTSPAPRLPLESSNLINNDPLPKDSHSLRLGALNEPHSGEIQGIRGADFACYRQARRSGLHGTFRAFLSSRTQNLDSIVKLTDRELPVVNLKGEILFNSYKDIFDGKEGFFTHQPRIYSFNGKNILSDSKWPQKIIWHGSYENGERALESSCDAWNSKSGDKEGLASSLLSHKLLSQDKFSCNNQFAVLCIEVTSQTLEKRRRKRNLEVDATEDDYNFELLMKEEQLLQRHLKDVITE